MFLIWRCILFSLKEERRDKLNHHMLENLFCSCVQHPGHLAFAVCFETLVENLIAIVFDL